MHRVPTEKPAPLSEGGVTPFDEEMEKHLAYHEAHYAKMRAAQSRGLAPTKMEQQQAQQGQAMENVAAAQGAQEAQQAQGAQSPPSAPPAPSSTAGLRMMARLRSLIRGTINP